jgi:hypothetical protein
MNLAQMRTLLPLIEAVHTDRSPGWGSPQIEEGDSVLNNLTPFSTQCRNTVYVWVLDSKGTRVHEYTQWVLDSKGTRVHEYTQVR